MITKRRVNVLRPGSVFRDWLLEILGDRINNKNCDIVVFKYIGPSHTVCRYVFEGEDYSVIGKFYAEPTGWLRHYDAAASMETEFKNLRKVSKIIDVPRPIAIKKEFDCALVTEYVHGRSLFNYMKRDQDLYDRLTTAAHLLRRLHDNTRSNYRKEIEFANFHKVLNQLGMDKPERDKYNYLLGRWWYSHNLNLPHGCMIHNDANPMNYIFTKDKLYALDFESAREHSHPVHDLGIIAAELKQYFEFTEKNREKAEQYIGHFLWHYSKANLEEFRHITKALPFFMSYGLLRMIRLRLGVEHSSYIFREAEACLRGLNG